MRRPWAWPTRPRVAQTCGQLIAEVLKRLDEERLIVKASSGPRYIVGCRRKVREWCWLCCRALADRPLLAHQIDPAQLKPGARVSLDLTTLTIMRVLPREVDPSVFGMVSDEGGKLSWASIGGLDDQIREVREVIELPLSNPELFVRVGIKPPKGVLLYGPPGTGKTLMARALASNMNATFLKVRLPPSVAAPSPRPSSHTAGLRHPIHAALSCGVACASANAPPALAGRWWQARWWTSTLARARA